MSENFIPEEILVQILKRLPVKTLVRFQSVCKGWKQLIDSPSLVLDHLALQKPRFSGMNNAYEKPEFLVFDPQTLPLFDTLSCHPFESQFPFLELIGTLHGLVCLYEYSMRRGIFLWNPLMRKLLNIHVPEDMQLYRDEEPEGCNFVPKTYSAFWIDPSTKDFKIIVFKMVYTIRAQWEKYGAIYSSSGDDWKELSVGDIADYSLSLDCPAVVMGKFAYWRAFYRIQSHQVDDLSGFHRAVVISFDIEQERFDIIEGPSVLYPSCHPSLYNWQGSLSLVYLDPEERGEIYSRQQDGSWLNLFRFNPTPNLYKVLGIMEERVIGEENCKILAITTELELVTFDTRDGCCVHLRSGDESLYYGFVVYDFVESLLFP